MNRLSDYDDQIIRATPYETLFNYRATVGYLLNPRDFPHPLPM
jgi:hypothetical protein